MANVKLANHVISEDDKRVLVNLFKDPLATQAFVDLLRVVKRDVKAELDKTTQVFLLNNDPVTRALALQQKGKVEFVAELESLIQTVVK